MNTTDFNKSKRFTNDNYNRPKKTIQDKLTPEEIEEKLESTYWLNKYKLRELIFHKDGPLRQQISSIDLFRENH